MANRVFKLQPQTVIGESGWTVVGGGTAAAALSKNGVLPGTGETPPSTNEPRLSTVTNGAITAVAFGTVGTYTLLKEIDELLKAGGTITNVRMSMYGENRTTTGKPVVLKWLSTSKSTEPEWAKLTPAWTVPMAMSEAQLLEKADTAAHLATALSEVVIEKKTTKETWVWELGVEVIVKEAEGHKVAGAVSGGASTTATTQRISQPAASGASGVTSHVRIAATFLRIAKTQASVSSGATVSAAVVKVERGAVTANISSAAVVAASLARRAQTSARVSTGASVAASVARRTSQAAAVSSGASVAARAQRVAQAAPRVSGGAVVTATVKRIAKATASITAGASVTARARTPLVARISAGAVVTANVTRVGQSPEPPTSTPVEGHVAVGQRGIIGVHRGRVATGNVGRAER